VSAELLLEKPALAQVDGDMLGTTSHIRFTVEPRALKVRVPSPAPVGQSRQ
jgi:diacylglycerol kinase (ATP)